jgi:glucokinase
MDVLAGDIGGTKTDLAVYRVEGPKRVRLVHERAVPSREYGGLEEVVRELLRDRPEPIAAAAFGVAGPVIEGKVGLTNLPWRVEAGTLAEAIGCADVRLMNDLETTAYGTLFLAPEEIHTLNEGVPRATHRVVIAAGTGLGQAILFWDGRQYRPTATEGGHVGFAPRDDREMGLLRFLLEEYDRVSYERVLSGPGLLNVFRYLSIGLGGPVDPEVRERMKREDPGAVVGESGISGRCPTCTEAVDMFVSLYGAQAANLVLSTMALGGVYVAGGIVTKLLPKVKAGGFMRAFRAGGRFEALLSDTPVHVVLNPRTSLLGAAEAALDMALERTGTGATT